MIVGIDSLMQVLILIMTVQLVGFFVLLVEIFKLSKLIKMEKYGITRFEKDLVSLEARGEHKAEVPSDALKKYVEKAKAQGVTEEQIRQKLVERGWKNEQITQVLPVDGASQVESK